MRCGIAPSLFQDDDPASAEAKRDTLVQKAEVSDRAKRKCASNTTAEYFPAHSFTMLLDDLATLTLNDAAPPDQPDSTITFQTSATPLQQRTFELLEVDPARIDSGTAKGWFSATD